MIFFRQIVLLVKLVCVSEQDVWEYSAATSSGGAAEAGGKYQEDLRQSGRRGHQGELEAHPDRVQEVYPFTQLLTLRLAFTNSSFQGQRV